MSAVPVWLRGRDLAGGTLAIYSVAVAANGTITDGASASLLGHWEEIRIEGDTEKEEISSSDATRQHNEILKNMTKVTITEILKRNGTNILAAWSIANDVGKFVVARGAQSWTFYGARGSYNETLNKGKSTGVLTLEMIDPGAVNPAYA